MELRHLKYFITVVEELSFSKAAKKLNISQPPLSKQIKQLEDELGTELILRIGNSIAISSQGQFFYQEAKKIISQTERLVHQLKNQHQEKKSLVIGYVLPAFMMFMEPLIEHLVFKYPNYYPQMKEYSSIKDFTTLLLNKELDIAFVYPPIRHSTLDFKVIYKEEIMVVLPENHPLKEQEMVKLEDLEKDPIITHPKEIAPELYDRLVLACLEAGFYPNIVREATPQQVRVQLVGAGLGICFASKSIQKLKTPGVVFKSMEPKFRAEVPIALAWHKESDDTVIKSILDWCKNNL